MEKEPFYQSTRFWTMVSGVIVSVVATFVDLSRYQVTPDELEKLLVSVAVMVGAFIWGRTVRNTK